MSVAPLVEQIQLGQLPVWRIRVGQAEALVACQGAHVLRYGFDGEPDIVWGNPEAVFEPGTPIRGGIPVCWPWFGDLLKNPAAVQAMCTTTADAPAHGLARQVAWQAGGVEVDTDRVRLDFHHRTSAETTPGWPHATELTLSLSVGERLELTLSVRNLEDHPLVLSQALHTYFAVSDVREVGIEGLANADYYDCLDGWTRKRQNGEPTITAETDRVYVGLPARLAIRDPQWQRRLFVETRNSHSAVLWNPWIDKAARLSQFADDAWTGMLCIETARVMDDVLTVAPGASAEMAVSLWREAL